MSRSVTVLHHMDKDDDDDDDVVAGSVQSGTQNIHFQMFYFLTAKKP